MKPTLSRMLVEGHAAPARQQSPVHRAQPQGVDRGIGRGGFGQVLRGGKLGTGPQHLGGNCRHRPVAFWRAFSGDEPVQAQTFERAEHGGDVAVGAGSPPLERTLPSGAPAGLAQITVSMPISSSGGRQRGTNCAVSNVTTVSSASDWSCGRLECPERTPTQPVAFKASERRYFMRGDQPQGQF